MRRYHVTIIMIDGSEGQHADAYPDGAVAALRAWALFPEAVKISVLRESTVQRRARQDQAGRAGAGTDACAQEAA